MLVHLWQIEPLDLSLAERYDCLRENFIRKPCQGNVVTTALIQRLIDDYDLEPVDDQINCAKNIIRGHMFGYRSCTRNVNPSVFRALIWRISPDSTVITFILPRFSLLYSEFIMWIHLLTSPDGLCRNGHAVLTKVSKHQEIFDLSCWFVNLYARYLDIIEWMLFKSWILMDRIYEAFNLRGGSSINTNLYITVLASGPSTSTWWRHQMEIYCALLDRCVENSPVTGEFPS